MNRSHKVGRRGSGYPFASDQFTPISKELRNNQFIAVEFIFCVLWVISPTSW